MNQDTDPVLLPCSKCGGTFPLDGFYKSKGCVGRYQRHSWCKACVTADTRRKRAERTAEERERDAVRNRMYVRRKRLRKYGLTPEQFDALLASQNGVCAICGKPETTRQPHRVSGLDPLAVDHDHVTGKVRGLLCFMCNTAIGKFNDDPKLLRRAADYVEAGR